MKVRQQIRNLINAKSEAWFILQLVRRHNTVTLKWYWVAVELRRLESQLCIYSIMLYLCVKYNKINCTYQTKWNRQIKNMIRILQYCFKVYALKLLQYFSNTVWKGVCSRDGQSFFINGKAFTLNEKEKMNKQTPVNKAGGSEVKLNSSYEHECYCKIV